MSSAICFNLDQSKILLSDSGLKQSREKALENAGKLENAGNWFTSNSPFSHNVFKSLLY